MVRVFSCRGELAFVASLVVLFLGGCSSGLEGSGSSATPASTAITSTNLRFGFDPGLVPTDPYEDTDIAGGLLPGLNGEPDRPVVFLAFTTEAQADDGDGSGTALDRSTPPPSDGVGSRDVFVAAVAADLIDERAFVYSLAGKFRHPRCVTCHSMNVTPTSGTPGGDTTAFATGAPHPGAALPVGIAANCAECHGAIPDWRAPAESFDLRNETAQALFVRSQQAINGPGGQESHFENDSRVLWALGSNGGALPFGNVADDDHDGILEPEDSDGVARIVPGGVGDFIERLRAWKESGQKFDSSESLQDLVLASRASAGNSTGNGDSFAPSTHYRANAAFDPMTSNPNVTPVGFLRVAYASDATNMNGGTANGATDVFLIDVNVFHRSDGSIDLVTATGSQTLVSRATAGQANGDSTSPELGGANGERVAFLSSATNLVAGFQNNNGADADVFAAEPGINSMALVSHAAGSANAGGDGASGSPRLDPTGSIVAFDSAASNLVAGDTNGARDVFYADAFQFGFDAVRASVADGGTEASGGDSFDPSVYAFPGTTEVRIAYTSSKTDLVTGTLPGANNVYLYDSRTGGGTTTLLNRIAGPGGTTGPVMNSASQDAGNPEIAADGMGVLFESMSADIDFVRPNDDNGVMDVMFADLALLESDGFVLPYTLSVGPDGSGGNAASSSPVIASLNPSSDEFPLGVAAFRTAATNLSNSDATGDADMNGVPDFENLVLMFVKEGATVVADFTATPGKQGMGRAVTFESTSSGNPTSFFWDFGDGSTSTTARPAHVYQNPGLYTVMMRAEGALGMDTRERVDYVRVVGPADAMFSSTKDASLSGVPQSAANNIPNSQTIRGAVDPGMASSLTFEFDSMDSTECPDVFDWRLTEVDIASGMPITTPVTIGTSEDAMTSVMLSGRAHYDLELVATGPGGSGTSATQRIEVWNRAQAAFAATSATSGTAPLTVSFQDTSTGDVDSLRWQRDGSDFSTVANPSETFAEGVYQVRLVADGLGGDQSLSTPITVTSFGALTASFSPSNQEFANSSATNLNFTNNSSGTPGVDLFYRWDFGNGSTSTLENPNPVTFTTSNENVRAYTIELIASTTNPAPADCGGMAATACDEATGTIAFFPPPSLTIAASAGASNPRMITITPQNVRGDGTGTNPSFRFLRSSEGGATANITLGTFSNANARTFAMPESGIYRFAVRLSTDGANGSTQTVTSSQVTQESFAKFDLDIYPVMINKCVSCHTGTANCTNNGGLTYSTATPDENRVYSRIVDTSGAIACLGGCGNPSTLINSGSTNPSNSFLYRKIAGTQGAGCGSTMPTSGTAITGAELDLFESWIRGGAIE